MLSTEDNINVTLMLGTEDSTIVILMLSAEDFTKDTKNMTKFMLFTEDSNFIAVYLS